MLIGINQYNPPGQASTDPPKVSPTRKGLVSGDVRHWIYPDLEGAVNDVNLVEALLLTPEFGFQPNDVVKLIVPEKTTAEEILATLERELVETATQGDVRLVYYSGHGNFIRNTALKRQNPSTQNEFDQTIVPSDHWLGAVDVRDKELAQILWHSAKKGVIVTFIADSCHSGSLTRGPASVRGRSRSHSGIRGAVDGVTFGEPLVDDASGNGLDPEKLGVLTVAAAQENQEALELWNRVDGTHGGMTLALVRAIREEGPHANMKRIFDRMSGYMQASNLAQTPILGGLGRADKDLLGQPSRQEVFSVLVKEVHGDEAILRGGEAIGLFEGSELRRPGSRADTPATLQVIRSLGLAESVSKIVPGESVVAGDRFEVTRWAAPQEPVLNVYVPPPAGVEVVNQAKEQLAALRNDPTLHWITDPTQESPNAILRWDSGRWKVDRGASDSASSDLGASPSAEEVKKALPNGARLFALMPPTAAISDAIHLGAGTTYPGIERLTDSDAARADYRLFGRLTAEGIQYAWVQADAEFGARELPTGSKRNLPPPGQSISSLPNRTDWSGAGSEQAGAALTEYAVRVGKVRGWLNLAGRPGKTEFPYRLALRKPGSASNAKSGVLYGGEQYKLFLQLDPSHKAQTTPRRWVYVFAIDQHGTGTLLFPRPERGNEGNHLPRAEKDQAATAPTVPLIGLTEEASDVLVDEPWGTDTYVLISTKDPIPDPTVLSFEGVQSTRGARGAGKNALQELIESCGDSTRGAATSKVPSEWSIERLVFQSVAKK